MGRWLLVPACVVVFVMLAPGCKTDALAPQQTTTGDASVEGGATLTDSGAGPACVSYRDKLGQACTSGGDCCGVDCMNGKCCQGVYTDCVADADCCSGTCRNGLCGCWPAGTAIDPSEPMNNCCTLNAKDGKCIYSRPGGSCAEDGDCETLKKCFRGRTCAYLTANAACQAGTDCLSGDCTDGKCGCRKTEQADHEQVCCADVGGECGATACCYGTCDGAKCACVKNGTTCARSEDCCSGGCITNGDPTGHCCGAGGEACSEDFECCDGKCTADKKCCKNTSAQCTKDDECCSGQCVSGMCCLGAGAGCGSSSGPCCGGLSCTLHFGIPPTSTCSK